MKKTKILFLIPLMLLAPILSIGFAHAVTPTQVCVTSPTVTDCSTPTTFDSTSFTVGSTLTVGVNIANSPAINAFSISIQTDGSVLQGIDVQIFNPAINNIPGGICIDGVPFLTPTFKDNKCTANDGQGIVSVTASAPGGTSFSGSGQLFLIDYKVVAVSGGIPIGYSQVCPGSSSAPNCVTLAGGGVLISGVVTSTSHFANLNDFSFKVSPSFQSFLPTASGSISVAMSPLGLFSGMATVANSVTPSGLTCSPASTSVSLPATVTLTCSGSNGTYNVTVTGKGAAGQFHSTSVTVIVSPPDFLFVAAPTTLSVARGTSATSTITSTPLSGFAGNVGLVLNGPTVAGLTVALSASTIPAASGSVTFTATASSTLTPNTYVYTVTGSSGSNSHTQTINVVVPAPDFALFAVPGVESEVPVSLSASTVVEARSLNSFSGTVNLSAQLVTNGIIGPFVGPMNILLNPSVPVTTTTSGTTTLQVTDTKSAALGNYTVIITATSGSLTHTTVFNFTLVDFSASITKTTFIPTPCAPIPGARYPGSCRDNAIINIASQGGLTGFNTSTLGSQFVGYNCVNTPIAAINPFGNTCVDYTEYYANGTLVPRALIKAGIAPIAQFTPRFAFPVPSNSLMCLLFSAGNAGLSIPPELAAVYNTQPGAFAGGFNGFNNGNLTDLPQFLDPTSPPGSTGLPCDGSDNDFFRTFSFPQTVPGTYKVFLDSSISVLDHPLGNITIIVPQAPQFTQLHFSHHLSLAKNAGVQTFVVGIFNPNPDVTLRAFVRITGVGSFGDKFVCSLTSVLCPETIVSLAPLQTLNNIAITLNLGSFPVGETFTFSAVIVWGATRAVRATSTTPVSPDIPTSGSFTLFP